MAMNWFKKKKKMDQATAASPSSAPEPEDSRKDLREPEVSKKVGLFGRLKKGLTKTRQILTTDIDDLFGGKNGIDDDMLEQLEELLITSDIGVQTTMDVIQSLSRRASRIKSAQALKETLKEEILVRLKEIPGARTPSTAKPHVVMVVGVNGVGKTTTIGKLAAQVTQKGQSALIVAADTFRAAAIEQLAIWAQRAGADMVKHKANADPAAVAYDGMEAALARRIDTVYVDTAGRLHTKINLMEELKKIKRTMAKIIPAAPHETLLVLDATTGQNALAQARMFHEALGVSGLALTKLDGTAKGGIVISICRSLNLPLQYIGVGEDIEDLQDFDPEQFADALF
jgi:fused signal recognition particle receptor